MESIDIAMTRGKLHTLFRDGSPTILFLHGLAGYGGEWKQVCELLDDGIGIIAPDQRGHGGSWDGSDIDVDRSAFLGDAVALVGRLSRDSVVVVGQSMGGLVAISLAASRPDLVTHLVLIEAGIRSTTEADLGSLAAWLDRWPSVFIDEDEAARFFGYDKPSTPAWVEGLARTPKGLERRFDSGTMLRTMRALAGNGLAVEWGEISAPTTLIRGAAGMISDDEMEEMVAARPDIRVIEVEDSGHDVHLDQPERVAAILSHIVKGTP